MKKLIFVVLLLLMCGNAYSQQPYDLFNTSCATELLSGEDNNDNISGGYFKPHRSDIGGAPSGQDFFPILIVFVQFYSESTKRMVLIK